MDRDFLCCGLTRFIGLPVIIVLSCHSWLVTEKCRSFIGDPSRLSTLTFFRSLSSRTVVSALWSSGMYVSGLRLNTRLFKKKYMTFIKVRNIHPSDSSVAQSRYCFPDCIPGCLTFWMRQWLTRLHIAFIYRCFFLLIYHVMRTDTCNKPHTFRDAVTGRNRNTTWHLMK